MFRRTKVCSALALAFGGGLLIPATPVFAQQLERVEITGSSIRRVDAETALPVTVITVEELTKQGITTAEQAMSRIAANQSNFGTSAAIGGTTGGKAEADLRGLSGPSATNANKTLVLLNGRRIANHALDAAAVDLNAIPLAAVSRIEVLRDGASAIYGTDAIAGVINFILRKDYTGFEISAEAQRPERNGGGNTDRVSLVGGFGNLAEQRFNIMGTLDWRKQDVLVAADRNFSKTGIIGTSRDAIGSGTSGTSFPGDLNGFEPSGPLCAPPGSIPRNTNPDNTGAFDSCRYDFSRDVDIIPKNEQITGLIRGSFAITPEHTISAEYFNSHNVVEARVAPVPQNHLMPQSSPFFPAGAPTTTIPDLNDPTGVGTVLGGVANWRAIPGGKRTSGDDSTTDRFLVEMQGLLAGWDYKTAIGQSRNKYTASVKKGYLNDDLIQQGVFNGTINPFGEQTPAGQAAIDAAQIDAATVNAKNTMNFADFRITRDLYQMAAGPLSGAFGVEARREKSAFENTDINAVLQNSLGIDPDGDTSGKRSSYAVYAEFAIPVIKNLDLTIAGRYDHYSDFGNTFNPKVGLRWQPVKEVLLRGSYNTGFRAPTLYDIYQPASRTFTSDSYNDPLLCPNGTPLNGATSGVVCDQQTLQRNAGPVAIGRPVNSLSPEKSKTFTVGAVFEPSSAFTFSVDYWDIRIRNTISGLPEQSIFGDPVKYASRFVRCSQLSAAERANIDVCLNFPAFDPIAFIDTPTENLGELRTHGLDLSASLRLPTTAMGKFAVTMDGTYVTGFEYQREAGGEFINALGRYSDNAPVFRWQHVAAVNWNYGPWGAVLAERFKSGYLDQDGTSQVGSYDVYDVSLAWTGIKNLTLSAGIKNLFDRDPPKSVQNTTFQRGYDPRFADSLGRTFLLRAAYKFF